MGMIMRLMTTTTMSEVIIAVLVSSIFVFSYHIPFFQVAFQPGIIVEGEE